MMAVTAADETNDNDGSFGMFLLVMLFLDGQLVAFLGTAEAVEGVEA